MKTHAATLIILLPSLSRAQHEENGAEDFLSWQDSPNFRGTMDIIWSCLFTVFVCVWTAVHLNVPAPPTTDTTVRLWARRIKWVGNCCMVPEIVLLLAAGQWSFARACWREMREIIAEQDQGHEMESGLLQSKPAPSPEIEPIGPYFESTPTKIKTEITRPKLRRSETFEQHKKRESDERWTLRHAFYANMGGFRLRDRTGAVHIITAKHINYLVQGKYIDLPKITPLEINDRSKSDSLAKFLAIMQVGWLAVQVVARTIQKLETTTLEITTLSFVVCTLGTFIAWYRKPYDVQTFVILEMPDHAIEDIDLKLTRRSDGTERDLLKEYVAGHQTSKVVDDNGNLLAPYNRLTIIDDGLPTFTASFTDVYGHVWGRRPYDANRIRNDRLPVMEKPVTLVCAITTVAYAGLHIAAWNIPLATDIEQLLWRVSALAMMGCVFAWFFMDHFEEFLARRRSKKGQVTGVIVPWWRIPASIVVTIVYSLCRLYVLVESFVALRKMPPSAYQQVDWGRWVPHI
ncbi:hypothetical protein G647_05857 [Cladophialophora carrionii CBS 160.54]|uniref:Uncharacterized protein n=1 Tax=Cladophialophora carrionii CBS 160.54 TaxID=1279043 RepID=V9D659_9EURO|nr:uncharacterized protein G647_05857 [Cladophialophora carrionii CBS 160.54]ETI21788.1 hypothetical protein G647_05857 [Cladophialophora carrionii CBS 160.54]